MSLSSIVIKARYLILVFFPVVLVAGSDSAVHLNSPNNQIKFVLSTEENEVAGRLIIDGQEIISRMPISLTLNGTTYPTNTEIRQKSEKSVSNTIRPVAPIVSASIEETYHEVLVDFDASISLRLRAYDDGVAFRWETRLLDDEVIVDRENLAFQFADDYETYYPRSTRESFVSSQENEFIKTRISEVQSMPTASAPWVVRYAPGENILITDVNVESYPGLWLQGEEGLILGSRFPGFVKSYTMRNDRNFKEVVREDYIARVKGTREFPWRALVVADDAGLLTSSMLYSLADPSVISDTSWIKPGKTTWDWFNNWYLSDVPFEPGINQATYKHYVDFAVEQNLEYVLIDEGWSVPGVDNLLNVVPELNMEELVAYANRRGIDIILWMTWTSLERQFDEAFDQFARWEIKGIKVDFMQRDDQSMMEYCQRIAATAAEHQLLVNFHGGSKPTGLHRKYPNVMTHESVTGIEQAKLSKGLGRPDLVVITPFTRMVVGPLDMTPGVMDNFTRETFVRSYENPGSLGTRCHQLGMFVVFTSPLQTVADSPSKYRRDPGVLAFISSVPTVWDETVVLEAEFGEHVAVARRHGDEWYIGALTNWTPREYEFDLSFLGTGAYVLTSWSDAPDADVNPTAYMMEERRISTEDRVRVKLAPGGGYAAKLQPVGTK